jgi:hypothetical protein
MSLKARMLARQGIAPVGATGSAQAHIVGAFDWSQLAHQFMRGVDAGLARTGSD